MTKYQDKPWRVCLEVEPARVELGYVAFVSAYAFNAEDNVVVGLTRKQVKKLRKQLKQILEEN